MVSGFKNTAATDELDRRRVPFEAREYDSSLAHAVYPQGLAVDSAFGVVKTLILQTTGQPVCAIISYQDQAHFRRIAKVVGVKDAKLMIPRDIELMTGYLIGGVSPFGTKTSLLTILDSKLIAQHNLYINGGRKGFQIKVGTDTVVKEFDWIIAEISK